MITDPNSLQIFAIYPITLLMYTVPDPDWNSEVYT